MCFRDGYNRWRDILKPSQILEGLCRKNGMPSPTYIGEHVVVGQYAEDDIRRIRDETSK